MLTQFVPIVQRVHGKHHPEFQEVVTIFNQMKQKMLDANANYDVEFAELRRITNYYVIPEDVCESYAMVYELLSELDEAYQSKE